MIQNMFFQCNPEPIEYDDPIIIMESYERTDATEDIYHEDDFELPIEERRIIDTIITESTTCLRLASSTPRTSTYQAYVINSVKPEAYQFCLEETLEGEDDEGNPIILQEPQCIRQETRFRDVTVPVIIRVKNAVVVGKWQNKDIIHIVSEEESLIAAPEYLTDEYRKMKNIHPDLHDEVHETIYEVEEEDPETHEMKKVHKRIKTKKWKDKGSPVVKKSERIPHNYHGVPVE